MTFKICPECGNPMLDDFNGWICPNCQTRCDKLGNEQQGIDGVLFKPDD
jgi:uncharacterized Zn finger protein (UPF0148 family)